MVLELLEHVLVTVLSMADSSFPGKVADFAWILLSRVSSIFFLLTAKKEIGIDACYPKEDTRFEEDENLDSNF